ncbi:MAG TPA: methyltransferase domain-containing protein [Gaiellaceae bacterium]|nr:methyltransferase domain-containing protein [Gaiellaceae bacterium]
MPGTLRKLQWSLRRRYSGVLWQNPVVKALMPLVDAADKLVRLTRGLGHLPPFSVRMHATSVVGEFGGRRWVRNGKQLTRTLTDLGLQPGHRVLEIGCGPGRQALALTGYLEEPGGYVGFDIDPQSIRACRAQPALAKFEFLLGDVENEVYNPGGGTRGSEYRFPFDDDSFDFIFLASVYTHLLEEDCANYASEMLRLLKPGGTAAVSTYLQGPPVPGQALTFPGRVGAAYVEYPEIPTKVVGYELGTFESWFAGGDVTGMRGRWRNDGSGELREWQDWVVVRVPAAA